MAEENITAIAKFGIFVVKLYGIGTDDKDEKLTRAFRLTIDNASLLSDIFDHVKSGGYFIYRLLWNSLTLEILLKNETSQIELENLVNSEEFRKKLNEVFSKYDLKIQFDHVEHSTKKIELKSQFEKLKKLTEEAVQNGRFLVDSSRQSVSGLFGNLIVLGQRCPTCGPLPISIFLVYFQTHI